VDAAIEEFLASLHVPVTLGNVDASMDTSDGLSIEIAYDLAQVGGVTIAAHMDDQAVTAPD